MHPNAFHAMRPRWGASKAKNRPGRQHEARRLPAHRRPPAAAGWSPPSRPALELQALTRQRADHIEASVAAVNQLAALLDEHWPGGKAVFASLDSDIALAFLERYPTPAGPPAHRRTAGSLVQAPRLLRRKPGGVLIERLRAAPKRGLPPQQARVEQLVRVQVQLVQGIRATIRDAGQGHRRGRAETHPYAPLFATCRASARSASARSSARSARSWNAPGHCEQLIAEAGVAPSPGLRQSPARSTFRFATNRRARIALTTFADNSRHGSDWAAKIYNDARARKKRHPHAVRILARAWLRVMWACWRDGTCYDPATRKINKAARLT